MGRRVVDVRPLRVAAFARLWAAGWVTAAGSQLTAIVVPLEIYGFSGSSAYVGLASLTGFVPMVVAARAAAGQRRARPDRRRARNRLGRDRRRPARRCVDVHPAGRVPRLRALPG